MKRKIVMAMGICILAAVLALTAVQPSAAANKENPQYGGELTWAQETKLGYMDEVYDLAYHCIIGHHTQEELLHGDWAKGLAGSGETDWMWSQMIGRLETGLLAEKWEIVDPHTFVYHLRRGIHFHNKPPVNGRELVADDVVYSINRIFEHPTSYVAAVHKGVPPDSVKALDKYTVEVKIPGNTGAYFRDISDCLSIVPKEMVEKWGNLRDWRSNIGTGPFMLTDFVPKSSATLMRNPNYWRTDPVHPKNKLPYVDKINILLIGDRSTQIAAMRTGKLDVMHGIEWEETTMLKKTNPEIKFHRYPYAYPWMLFMRSDRPPFNDIRVRHALALAMDNQAIAEQYYGGEAQVQCYMVADTPTWRDAYTPLEKLPQKARELFEYHPDKAKQLLAEAGYPKGFKTEILYGIERQTSLLSLIKGYWEKIGVDAELNLKSWSVFNSIWVGDKHKAMVYRYWSVATPYKFNPIRPGPAANISKVNDPKCKEAYAKIQNNWFNEPLKLKVLKETVPYVIEKHWMLQHPNPYLRSGWHPWIKGYHGEYVIGYHNHGNFGIYLWIDQAMKKKRE